MAWLWRCLGVWGCVNGCAPFPPPAQHSQVALLTFSFCVGFPPPSPIPPPFRRESFSQSVSARVAPVGYVFPSGEPMREVQLAVDPVSGTASANLFLLRDASVADADLPEAITTVLLTAAHETTSDAPVC